MRNRNKRKGKQINHGSLHQEAAKMRKRQKRKGKQINKGKYMLEARKMRKLERKGEDKSDLKCLNSVPQKILRLP